MTTLKIQLPESDPRTVVVPFKSIIHVDYHLPSGQLTILYRGGRACGFVDREFDLTILRNLMEMGARYDITLYDEVQEH